MRRLKAAATPVTFFLGVALIGLGLALLARWPDAHHRVDGFNARPPAQYPELSLPWWWLEEVVEFAREVGAATPMAVWPVLGVIALGAFAVVSRKRPVAAGLGLGACVLIGTAALGLAWLDLRESPAYGFTCVGVPGFLRTGVAWVATGGAWAAATSLLAAVGWLAAQRKVRPTAVFSAAIALSLLGVGLHQGARAVARWLDDRPLWEMAELPPLVLWPFGALFVLGVVVSLRRSLFVSRLVSIVVLVMGGLATAAGVAVAHDADLPAAPPVVLLSSRSEPLALRGCEEPVSAPTLYVDEHETLLSGALVTRNDDSLGAEVLLQEKLEDERKKFIDLHEAANDMRPFVGNLSLQVDAKASLSLMARLLAASERATFRQLQIVAASPSPVQPWTSWVLHERVCAVSVVLANDGRPISSFASWAELVRAADDAATPLRLNVH